MKNDNFHTFFSLSWLQMLNLPALLQNRNTRIGPFPWKRSVLQNTDRERTNQSTGICNIIIITIICVNFERVIYFLSNTSHILSNLLCMSIQDLYRSWKVIISVSRPDSLGK